MQPRAAVTRLKSAPEKVAQSISQYGLAWNLVRPALSCLNRSSATQPAAPLVLIAIQARPSARNAHKVPSTATHRQQPAKYAQNGQVEMNQSKSRLTVVLRHALTPYLHLDGCRADIAACSANGPCTCNAGAMGASGFAPCTLCHAGARFSHRIMTEPARVLLRSLLKRLLVHVIPTLAGLGCGTRHFQRKRRLLHVFSVSRWLVQQLRWQHTVHFRYGRLVL